MKSLHKSFTAHSKNVHHVEEEHPPISVCSGRLCQVFRGYCWRQYVTYRVADPASFVGYCSELCATNPRRKKSDGVRSGDGGGRNFSCSVARWAVVTDYPLRWDIVIRDIRDVHASVSSTFLSVSAAEAVRRRTCFFVANTSCVPNFITNWCTLLMLCSVLRQDAHCWILHEHQHKISMHVLLINTPCSHVNSVWREAFLTSATRGIEGICYTTVDLRQISFLCRCTWFLSSCVLNGTLCITGGSF
jgi:hypothetical protein